MRMTRGLRRSVARRRPVALGLAAVLGTSVLAACGSLGGGSGKPELVWYINPDSGGQAAVAKNCSTDQYTITTQVLPQDSSQQRIQLARRLAAHDTGIDLMSLDPPFTAEFSDAGFLAEIPADEQSKLQQQSFQGAVDAATWGGKLVVYPFWSNTQVLWYRKSFVQKAGLDMSQPVTWDQVIDAAVDQGGTVGVQANRYEAYVVWINALMQGAGGDIVSDTEAGREAKVDLDSDAGRDAAAVISKLAGSDARQADFTVSNEGTSLGQMFPAEGPGEFMVNWTFVYKNYEGLVGSPGGPADEQEFEDLAWARYPQTVEGEDSKPPIGGIDIGVGAYSENGDLAMEAAQCITSTEAQVDLAVNDGLMPSTNSAYEEVAATGDFPEDLLDLYRTSVDEGGPRPKSPFYSQISSAVQSVWHSPTSVNPDSTPQRSADYLADVLAGKKLL